MSDSIDDAVCTALAAITGQTIGSVREQVAVDGESGADASPGRLSGFVENLCTRIGLAPAIDGEDQRRCITAVRDAFAAGCSVPARRLGSWESILRATPEQIPTLGITPIVLPDMPSHQEAMWRTLVAFESSQPFPWVLVGGQMTALHRYEHADTSARPTDDGDIVVGVWTRRSALREASRYLVAAGYEERATVDGYGYRYSKGKALVDVMIPEGLGTQKRYPSTGSGRPGLGIRGGNQALTRAVRVPVDVAGLRGYVRRPTLLGSLVVKAHAWVEDGREPDRHAQDVVALAEIAFTSSSLRAMRRDVRPDDGRVLRRALGRLPVDHRAFAGAREPAAVRRFLEVLSA